MKLKLLFLALVVVGLTGCQTQTQDERPQPVADVQQAAFKNDPLTLSDFQNNPNLMQINPPAGFVPGMQGVWNYDQVYLFQVIGTSDVLQVYTFSNSQDRDEAMAGCNLRYFESSNSCSEPGNECSVDQFGNKYFCV